MSINAVKDPMGVLYLNDLFVIVFSIKLGTRCGMAITPSVRTHPDGRKIWHTLVAEKGHGRTR